MKRIILLFAIMITAGMMIAQNLSLSNEDGPIEPNSTIYMTGDPTQVDPMTARINVTNNASSAMNILVKKVIVDTVTGSNNYFCWGVCYPAWVYISPMSVAVEAGATTEEFYGDYEPLNQPGKSHIMYVWWNEANPDDSVAVTVEYNASPAGIEDPLAEEVDVRMYPNPASTYVTFDYNIASNASTSKILISNILGAMVMEINLDGNEGTERVNVSELTEGIYFYNLLTNNRLVETRKLIIKH